MLLKIDRCLLKLYLSQLNVHSYTQSCRYTVMGITKSYSTFGSLRIPHCSFDLISVLVSARAVGVGSEVEGILP